MSKYQVGYWYNEYGTVVITADSPEEAEQKLNNALSAEGLEGLDKFGDVRINDVDRGAQDAEEI